MDEMELLRRADPTASESFRYDTRAADTLARILEDRTDEAATTVSAARPSLWGRLPLSAAAAAAVAGLVLMVSVLQPRPDAAGPSAPQSVQAEVVQADLPSGLRQAAIDTSTGTLWILTRTDADNSVRLTAVSGDTVGSTLTLSQEGQDWAAGALAFKDGLVWATWGAHLVSIDPNSGSITPVKVPWQDGHDGQAGRSVSAGAAGSCIWIAVMGEHQVRCYDPAAGDWSTTPTPNATVVSPFTRIAAGKGSVYVNLGPDSADPALPSGAAGEIAWVPANTIPLLDPRSGTVVDIGDRQVAASTSDRKTSAPLSATGQPALTIPSTLSANTVIRVFEFDGALFVDRTDVITGAASRSSAALPTVTVTPHYAPEGSTPHLGWAATKVSAVAAAEDGTLWVVTSYATDSAPKGWGPLIRVPTS